MFGARTEKFRSIRTYPGVFQVRGVDGSDFSEFTKSEREKSAETLFDWRSRNGWHVSKKSARGLTPAVLWIALHSIFALSALLYYFL